MFSSFDYTKSIPNTEDYIMDTNTLGWVVFGAFLVVGYYANKIIDSLNRLRREVQALCEDMHSR